MIFFVSTIFTIRNYYSNLVLYSKKTEALNICANKLNETKALDFDEVVSLNGTTTIGTAQFTYKIEVSDYIKEGNIKVDNAKVIESIVSFNNNKADEVRLKYIKVNDNEQEN